MARIHGRREERGWTRSSAMRVVSSIRDQRGKQAAGNHSNLPDHEPSDPALRRLAALERLLPLGDWEALREWRLSQLAMLFPGKTFPEPKQIDLSKILR